MNDYSSKPDYIIIAIIFLLTIGGIITLIKNYREISIKLSFLLLFIGISFIFFSAIGNSFIEKKWTTSYILSFLLLKEVSKGFFFRHLCSFGYPILSWGIICILITIGVKMFSPLKTK